jgi:hypothetical protein
MRCTELIADFFSVIRLPRCLCTNILRAYYTLNKYTYDLKNWNIPMDYEGGLKSSQLNNKKNEFIISKLFLFFNIISLKTNTFIPAMLQHHYSVPVAVLRKICKIPLYSCNRLLIRRQTLTSEKEFWEEIAVRGSQIWEIG